MIVVVMDVPAAAVVIEVVVVVDNFKVLEVVVAVEVVVFMDVAVVVEHLVVTEVVDVFIDTEYTFILQWPPHFSVMSPEQFKWHSLDGAVIIGAVLPQ